MPQIGSVRVLDISFATVDVFTDRQFGGNPLAVVLNADGLATHEMQLIAAEFNLAEATFVLPPRNPLHTAEIRIFTPKAELPFAGHPNVGTAFVLAQAGKVYGNPLQGNRLVFEEQAGLVNVDLIRNGGQVIGARISAPKTLDIASPISVNLVAEACSLQVDDVDCQLHAPLLASTGAAFVLAALRSRAALARATPHPEVFQRSLASERATGIFLYAPGSEKGIDFQARMFAPLHGIPEDPATGSANLTLVALHAHLHPDASVILSKSVGQGYDMGRRSLLKVTAEKRDGIIVGNAVEGQCVPVMKGVIALADT